MAKRGPTLNEMLTRKLALINGLMGLPLEPYDAEKQDWNPGVFHLSSGYNGVELCRMSRHGGSGTENPLSTGFVSKKVMLEYLNVLAAGIQLGKSFNR